MAEQRHADDGNREQSTGKALKRRGILAAAGAVVAGIVAKQAPGPVSASPTAILTETNNHAFSPTALYAQVGYTSGTLFTVGALDTSAYNTDAIQGLGGGPGTGVVGQGGSAGVQGGYGVLGIAGNLVNGGGSGGSGVVGLAPGAIDEESGRGVGVFGTGYGSGHSRTGVLGLSDAGIGVYGFSLSSFAVAGVTTAQLGGSPAVFGSSAHTSGVYGMSGDASGVYGTSSGAGNVAGVYGTSTTAYGIIGNTTAPGYSGLTAITGTTGVAALAATSTNPSAYAAYFQGTTVVQGNFAVVSGTKSAAVKDATGQHRLVYCMESPESWFEDFGKGQLVNGKAEVTLDPVFAQIVHADDYQVFVTPDDDCKGFFVTGKSATGFAVRERQGGTSSIGFSYRVVAKRKDIKGERLAKFEVPKIRVPDESKLPKPEPPPALPRKP